jgi:type II secretory pathway component PulF
MEYYAFYAIDQDGRRQRGRVQVANENELFIDLRMRGLTLIHCRILKRTPPTKARPSLPLNEQILFFRHLFALLRAGIPLHQACSDIETSLPRDVRVYGTMLSTDLLNGEGVSAIFKRFGSAFDPLCVVLMSAGEKTGRMNDAIAALLEGLTWKNIFNEKAAKALSYPIVQIVLSLIAVLVLLNVALPQILNLLTMTGQELPFYSVLLIFLMQLLAFVFLVISAAAFIFFIIMPFIKNTHDDIEIWLERKLFKLPFIGSLLLKQSLAQLMYLLCAMLNSGLSMTQSLLALPPLILNKALRTDLQKANAAIQQGDGLTAAFNRYLFLPSFVTRLLKVGEDEGRLNDILHYISKVYQEESQNELDRFLKILSLLITLSVGCILIAMVIGVMVPLYSSLNGLIG